MKTFKLNGFEVVVCCDLMGEELVCKEYWMWIEQPIIKSSATNWYEEFGLMSKESYPEVINNCPHCEREIEVK